MPRDVATSNKIRYRVLKCLAAWITNDVFPLNSLVAAVNSEGYFNEVAKDVAVGDIIFVRDSNTPTMNIVVVLSNTGTVVDVSDGTAITVADAD